MPQIRVRDNGPLLVEAEEVELVDAEGHTFMIERRPFALCRCGLSARKPFCDGTHHREGFHAVTRAGD